MNKKAVVLAVWAIALVFVLGAAPARGVFDSSFDLVFDGYCDGLHINRYAGGTADGNQTGCVSGPILGNAQVGLAALSYDDSAAFGYGLHTTIRGNHTWTHYQNDGGGIYIINSGTWSFGTPLGDGPPSASR